MGFEGTLIILSLLKTLAVPAAHLAGGSYEPEWALEPYRGLEVNPGSAAYLLCHLGQIALPL